jgi:hypothetical protein
MKTKKTIRDLYSFPGFRARATLKPHTEDPEGYIVRLERRQKKRSVPAVAQRYQASETEKLMWFEILMPEQSTYILSSNIAGSPARTVKP